MNDSWLWDHFKNDSIVIAELNRLLSLAESKNKKEKIIARIELYNWTQLAIFDIDHKNRMESKK